MSLCLYAVRCNFTGEPAREAAWHAWYDGPKTAQMLELPLFLTMQRFAAASLDTRRKYLALWLVRSPDAFTTPEYRAQWGFAEWTPLIADWSRDLYAAPDRIDALVDIGPRDALHLVAFDGMSVDKARASLTRARDSLPGATWLEAVGLDRHSPFLGLRKVARGARISPLDKDIGASETIFDPITPRRRARVR
ncbi:MAG TPA: hypothetical protein VN802_23675 [Stellaceae bacterium]|nr:hypothetical protein [Stellaceae bacterium]